MVPSRELDPFFQCSAFYVSSWQSSSKVTAGRREERKNSFLLVIQALWPLSGVFLCCQTPDTKCFTWIPKWHNFHPWCYDQRSSNLYNLSLSHSLDRHLWPLKTDICRHNYLSVYYMTWRFDSVLSLKNKCFFALLVEQNKWSSLQIIEYHVINWYKNFSIKCLGKIYHIYSTFPLFLLQFAVCLHLLQILNLTR